MTRGDKEAIWKRFGAFVRRLRVEKGLGLREVSRLAIAEVGERGLSPTYLSAIERGLTAPPREPVRDALAKILDCDAMDLKATAEGWVVLDIEQVLTLLPKHKLLLQQLKQGDAKDEAVAAATVDVLRRYRAKGKEGHFVSTIEPGGRIRTMFVHRPGN